MRLSGLMTYDIADNDNGLCVSIWFQGCPHHCKGCHNPETWSFSGGKEIDEIKFYNKLRDLIDDVYYKTGKVNISLLGGEPLCPENIENVFQVLDFIYKLPYSDKKIFCWTGYYYKTELKKRIKKEKLLKEVLNKIDVLIDGRFILEKRNTTLKLRGSSNQNIYIKKHYFFNKLNKFVINN